MSGPTPPKVRIKVYSKKGQHRVTVVGDDGFEAELSGCSNVRITVEPGEIARLSAEFIEFESPDVKDVRG